MPGRHPCSQSAMNWKLKAHVLAVLSRTPGGKGVYHALQHWLRTDRDPPEEYVSRTLEILQMIGQQGRSAEKGTFLEIGTGWKPYLPFVLYLAGAERILTLDVNPWLRKSYIIKTYQALAPFLPRIAKQIGIEVDRLEERYRAGTPRGQSLAELLRACRVDYRCPADARQTGLPDGSVDFVVSSNVLEHIPEDVLRAMHRESFRVLRPGGLAVHRFNPEDHFSGGDRSITRLNFLRFSQEEWHWYGGSGLAYHNRLRCRQHQRLFEEAGFLIRSSRVRIDQRGLEAVRSGVLPVHPDFGGFTAEELAGDYMWLVAMRPPAADVR